MISRRKVIAGIASGVAVVGVGGWNLPRRSDSCKRIR